MAAACCLVGVLLVILGLQGLGDLLVGTGFGYTLGAQRSDRG